MDLEEVKRVRHDAEVYDYYRRLSGEDESCTCEPGEYPDILCPEHGMYMRRVTLIGAARYHPKFGNTPLERATLKRWKGERL